MCHLPDGGKLTLTNFHFTRYHSDAAEQAVPDVPSLSVTSAAVCLGVNDVKHGFTEAVYRGNGCI